MKIVVNVPVTAEQLQRIRIRTLDGEVLAQWGSQGPAPEQFTDFPHSIWVDSRGDIYVSEVTAENKIQKYTLVQEWLMLTATIVEEFASRFAGSRAGHEQARAVLSEL